MAIWLVTVFHSPCPFSNSCILFYTLGGEKFTRLVVSGLYCHSLLPLPCFLAASILEANKRQYNTVPFPSSASNKRAVTSDPPLSDGGAKTNKQCISISIVHLTLTFCAKWP